MSAPAASGITPGQIESTYSVIQPHIRVTPTLEISGSDFGLDAFPLVCKLEHLQHAGSFKTRGAFANLLLRQVPPAGVVAASGGNHGAAVAYAAMRTGRPARIFVPTVSSPAKIARIRSYGAELKVGGDRYADALAASQEWAAGSGALEVHAYDQAETLLGQATLGLELSRQVSPPLDTLLVPVGAPTLSEALRAGRPVDAPAGSIAADSLAPRQVGQLMFPIAERFVERVVLVSDAAIRDAQAALWSVLRLVVEPGGAASVAALLSRAYVPGDSERVGVILSGANTTSVDFEAA